MDPQPLNVKVDSKQAQADLAALARALDTAGNSATTFQSKFVSGMKGADTAVKGATSALGKFAEVAALTSRIRISDDPAKQLKALTSALSQLSKIDSNIKGATSAMGKFAEVAAQVDRMKINPATVKNLTEFASAINTMAKTRAPSPASLKGLVDFIEVAARAQNLKFNPAMAANMRAFAAAMDTIGRARIITTARIGSLKELFQTLDSFKAPNGGQKIASLFQSLSNIKVPSEASIKRLESMFKVLGSASAVPGAAKIAHDLDTITNAANRAAHALNSMPNTSRGVNSTFSTPRGPGGGGGRGGGGNGGRFNNNLNNIPGAAGKAHASIQQLTKGLGELDQRFSLSYQAMTLFSQFFSAFTFGEFLHKLYDTNIELLKMQKALLFSTGSFEGAARATDTFIGISNDLGLSIDKTSEAYSRFTISAKASNLDLQKSNDIYKAVGLALQVSGASSEQAGLAFYGLTKIMQRGTVEAAEFSRELGKQIPGNAVFGARALTVLEGHVVTTSEFMEQMQKRMIDSSKFLPEYARQLEAAFNPLRSLLLERPDAALHRLTNSFFVFSREVGAQGPFVELTKQLDLLTAKITYTDEYGVVHLTKGFKDLADGIGRGLNTAIRAIGDGLSFLATHIDEVTTALKLMLALRVTATFADWGKSAIGFGASLTSAFGKKAAPAAAPTAQAIGSAVAQALGHTPPTATAAAATSAAAVAAGAIGPLAEGQVTRDIIGRRSIGPIRTTTAERGFFSRWGDLFAGAAGRMGADVTPLVHPTLNRAEDYKKAFSSITDEGAAQMASESRQNWLGTYRASARVGANALEEGPKAAGAVRGGEGLLGALGGFLNLGGGAKAATAGVEEAAVGAEKAAGIFGKFGGVLGKVVPLLGFGLAGALAAAGIALAVFGQNTTTVQGKTMKFNDIVLGGFNVLSKGVSDWWNKSKPNFKFFTDGLDVMSKHSGDIVANIVAGFVTLGKVIGRVLVTIGTVISEFVQHSPLATFAKMMAAIVSGDFKGAKAAFNESFSSGFGLVNIGKSVGDLVTGTASDIKDFDKTRQSVIDAGAQIAAARDQKNAADAATAANNRLTEAQLAQMQSASDAAEKQAEIDSINRKIALGNLSEFTPEQVIARARADFTAPVPTVPAAVAAGTSNVSADLRGKASAEVQKAIDDASAKYGVSASYLYQTAQRESNFNANAHAKTTSAGGLYQFTDATAASVGLQNRFDAAQAADAAAKLTAANAAYLSKALGTKDAAYAPTDADLYAAHFLGAAGAAKLIKATQTNQAATAAELFPAAAASNHNIFYDKTTGRAKSVGDVMSGFQQSFGVNTAAAGPSMGPGAGPMSQQQEETLAKQFETASASFNTLIADSSSPAEAATAKLAKLGDAFEALMDKQRDLNKQGIHSFIDPDKVAKAFEHAQKVMEQTVNPFLKVNEEMENSNKVLELRAQGLSDAADFQEKLNGYVLQGYDATKLDTKANRDAMIAQKDRNDLLQSQIDLIKERNSLTIAQIGRNQGPVAGYIASHIKIDPGKTYEQALQDAQDNGTLANVRTAANLNEGVRRGNAIEDLNTNLSEARATSTLSASQKQYRDDYKSYLESLTGISGKTLDYLEKQDPALTALAKHAADIKESIDNMPGFEKWADSVEPLSKKLNDIKANFAEGLSDNIAKSLNGDKVNWSDVFKSMREQVIKAQVDQVLSAGIKLFNGGKKPEALMTPDEKIKASADATTSAAGTLTTAGSDLSSAASSLTSAAQAIAQAVSGGSLGASAPGAASGSPFNGGGSSGLLSGNGGNSLIGGNSNDNYDFSSQYGLGNLGFGSASSQSGGLPSLGDLGGYSSAASGGGSSDIFSQGMGSVLQSGADPITTITAPRLPITPYPSASDIIPAAAVQDSLNANFVPFDASSAAASVPSLTGGGGGILSSIGKFFSGGAGSAGSAGGLGGIGQSLGLVGILSALTKRKKKHVIPRNIPGIIGQATSVDVTGKFKAASSNPIADVLDLFVSNPGSLASLGKDASSLFSSVGKGASSLMSSAGSFFAGLFKEGGYMERPVASAAVPMSSFKNAPHYAEGTANTSGGTPAILHPNEAVIPLSRGRSVPVEMNGAGQTTNHYTTNMTIVTPNADSFRKSQSSIERDQSMASRRSSIRNLSGG